MGNFDINPFSTFNSISTKVDGKKNKSIARKSHNLPYIYVVCYRVKALIMGNFDINSISTKVEGKKINLLEEKSHNLPQMLCCEL